MPNIVKFVVADSIKISDANDVAPMEIVREYNPHTTAFRTTNQPVTEIVAAVNASRVRWPEFDPSPFVSSGTWKKPNALNGVAALWKRVMGRSFGEWYKRYDDAYGHMDANLLIEWYLSYAMSSLEILKWERVSLPPTHGARRSYLNVPEPIANAVGDVTRPAVVVVGSSESPRKTHLGMKALATGIGTALRDRGRTVALLVNRTPMFFPGCEIGSVDVVVISSSNHYVTDVVSFARTHDVIVVYDMELACTEAPALDDFGVVAETADVVIGMHRPNFFDDELRWDADIVVLKSCVGMGQSATMSVDPKNYSEICAVGCQP